jgi:hypothetical protein
MRAPCACSLILEDDLSCAVALLEVLRSLQQVAHAVHAAPAASAASAAHQDHSRDSLADSMA